MLMEMMMEKEDDEWITAAMNDDSMVAELLLRIKRSTNASRPERSVPAMKVRSGWGGRRLRSGTRSNEVDLVKKDGETTRYSPATPFSWSEDGTTTGGGGGGGGCGSSSTTADGCETSGRFDISSPTSRSKGAITNEAVSSNGRKPGKIKTFAELKEEESTLMKERLCLNKELTTSLATFKNQKSRNESFKRLKVDHNLQDPRLTWAAPDSNYTHQTPLALPPPGFYERRRSHSNYAHRTPLALPKHAPSGKAPKPGSLKLQNSNSVRERNFIVPDLNVLPIPEDSPSYYS